MIDDLKCDIEKIVYDNKMKKQSFFDFIELFLNKFLNIFDEAISDEMIPKRILEKNLILFGWVVIIELTEKDILLNKDRYKPGLYMFTTDQASLVFEPDVLNQPTAVIINSPAIGFNSKTIPIRDVILIKNTETMFSFLPLFIKYATLLSTNEQTMYVVDILVRMQMLVSAEDDNIKESAEKYINDIINGKLGVITGNDLIESIKTSPYYSTTTNYMTQLIEYHQYLKASWLQDLTLNANFNMKRESLTESEIGLNDESLKALKEELFESRLKGFNEVNKKFNRDWKITKKDVTTNESIPDEDKNNN